MSSYPPDRRAHERRPFATEGSNPLVATVGVVPRAAFVCDLSAAGLAMLTTDPPPVGSVVPVWLAVSPSRESQLVLVRVIDVTAVSTELHRVGAESVEEAGAAVLQQVLAEVK